MSRKPKKDSAEQPVEAVNAAGQVVDIKAPRAKARQAEIPGTERKRVEELDHAAEAYVEARDKRMALSEDEHTAKEALIAAMRKSGLSVYRDEEADPPLTVTLTPGKDQVKVTVGAPEADDDAA